MFKKITAVNAILGILMSGGVVWAMPSFEAVHVTKSKNAVNVVIPENAVEITDGVFDLGFAVDSGGRVVQGLAFVHYKKGYEHKNQHPAKNGGKTASSCFAHLAKGARWKVTENYRVNPVNTEGIDEAVVRGLLADALGAWDSEVAFNVFGTEEAGAVDGAEIGNLNEKNEFMFGSIDSAGAIAVTYVWGIFYGPPGGRELVEWDMVFDQDDFVWSADAVGVSGAMDFLNIAAHEVGHAAGMGHPSDGCVEETMYRFAGAGEIKKRDLNAGDISGIKALYK
jgi:hypothetical protein